MRTIIFSLLMCVSLILVSSKSFSNLNKQEVKNDFTNSEIKIFSSDFD